MSIEGDVIKRNISKNIVKYREKLGISQKEFASRLGITPSRVSNWEQGANCPTIDILFEVCKVLNVSINDIYGVYPDTNMTLSFSETEHIKKYRELNAHGKEMVDIVLEKEYTHSVSIQTSFEKDNIYMVNAAHERTDIEVTDEMRKHDDDIMDDENF
jgi:transcriptional regulator with XRE-family HTH domain